MHCTRFMEGVFELPLHPPAAVAALCGTEQRCRAGVRPERRRHSGLRPQGCSQVGACTHSGCPHLHATSKLQQQAKAAAR